MILTCQNCSTRYLIDPRALGATGRRVRCAKCYHIWYQAPPEDAPLRLDGMEASPAEAEPPPIGSGNRVQLPALPERRRRPWVAVGWLVLFLVIVGGAAAAGWKADEVMKIWPESARLYQWVGLVPSQPTDWYTIKIEPRRDEENGVPRLVIHGELINNSAVAQPVPKLKVELHDASERVVQSWTFTASTERLLPGASVPFTTSVAQPNEAATGVTVTVAGKDE